MKFSLEVSAYEIIIESKNRKLKRAEEKGNVDKCIQFRAQIDQLTRHMNDIAGIHLATKFVSRQKDLFVTQAKTFAMAFGMNVAVWELPGHNEFYITDEDVRLKFIMHRVKFITKINKNGELYV